MTGTTKDTRHSFGWRVMTERKQAGLTQSDVCERLEKEFGINLTYAALSQIETGETKRFNIDQLFALAKTLNVDPYTLLTGEERGEITHYSAEAEMVAQMVDQMQPLSRQMMVAAARSTLELEQQLESEIEKRVEKRLFEEQRQMAYLLRSYINHLETDRDRKLAHEHIERIENIERIGHNRNDQQ